MATTQSYFPRKSESAPAPTKKIRYSQRNIGKMFFCIVGCALWRQLSSWPCRLEDITSSQSGSSRSLEVEATLATQFQILTTHTILFNRLRLKVVPTTDEAGVQSLFVSILIR